jgi:hypothetical protein
MPRIPGTTFHDEDPPKPDVDELRARIRFYESVMAHQPPHHRDRDHLCKIAETLGLDCCNPLCKGVWGTGCWCCHSLRFAAEASPEAVMAHLALVLPAPPVPTKDPYEERSAPIIQALQDYLTNGNHPRSPIVEMLGRHWSIPEIIAEIRNRTPTGRAFVSMGTILRAAHSIDAYVAEKQQVG